MNSNSNFLENAKNKIENTKKLVNEKYMFLTKVILRVIRIRAGSAILNFIARNKKIKEKNLYIHKSDTKMLNRKSNKEGKSSNKAGIII